MALALLVISFLHHPPENLDGLKIYVCKDSKAAGLCPWKPVSQLQKILV